jgi:hypothetical protein
MRYNDTVEARPQEDDYDKMIEQYSLAVEESNSTDPLAFWRANESRFPALALIAKKFLGVPASSAKRMFSIAGHIFSLKRRKLGVVIFRCLVLLKLNETLF